MADYLTESFDHSRIARLPEYAAASQALDDLVQAINKAKVEVDREDWFRTIEQMARALPYADYCAECGSGVTPAPYAGDVNNGWLSGRYRCPAGHTWKCGYSTSIVDQL